MADDSENLVSQITVTGGEEATAQVQQFADKSAAAFGTLDASVTKSALGVQKATDSISRSAADAGKGIQQVGASAQGSRLDAFNKQLGELQGAIGNVTQKFPQLAQAIGRFATRLASATAAAGAAGIGLALAAQRVAKEVDGQNTALADQTKSQVDANNAALKLTEANINLESEQRKLFQQASQGKITWSQYAQSLRQLQTDFNEQQRTARQLAAAQDDITAANERLQKQLKDRTAYQQLTDTFGGPLLTSLISFGRQVEQVRISAVSSFGPALAGLVDTVAGVVTKNSSAINAFFQTASQKITQLIATNGPAIETFLTNIGAAAAAVFNGIIAAAPGVIDFFNNVLVPSIKKVANFLTGIADGINAIFGTQLTAGSIILIAILAQVTGSIRVLTTVLKLVGATSRASFKVLEEGGLLLNTLFGGKTTGQVIKFGAGVAGAGGPLKTFFALIRRGLPLLSTFVTFIATTFGVSFGVAAIAVAALGVALFYIIKNTDWKGFAADAKAAVNGIINVFNRIVTGVGIIARGIAGAFQSAWDGLVSAATLAVGAVMAVWDGVVAFFVTIADTIGSVLSAVWDTVVAAASAAWDAIVASAQVAATAFGAVWTAVVSFFSVLATAIGNALSGAWNATLAAANVVIAAVSAAWSGLVATLTTIATSISTAISGAWTAAKLAAQGALQAIIDGWNSLVQFFTDLQTQVLKIWTDTSDAISKAFSDAFAAISTAAKPFVDTLVGILQPVLDAIKTISNAISGGGGDTGGAPAFAGGGHVSGPGTSTSDSILALLSNNEYVMRARAVQKYGVSFMNAVNSGSLNLNKLRGFSLGGLVDLPRFASGGLVGAAPHGPGPSDSRPFTLNIGEQSFTGLRADQSTVEAMTRYASGKSLRSAGRKPLWYRG